MADPTQAVADDAVLVVVDMQVGFINQDTADLVPSVVRFANTWIESGRTAIVTQFVNESGSQHERLIHWTGLRDPDDVALAPGVADLDVPTIEKTTYTALNAHLLSHIDNDFRGDLFLCGIATDGCVLKTAVDAFERGWTPRVITDLCASHGGDEIHQAGLALLARFIGRDQLLESKDLVL